MAAGELTSVPVMPEWSAYAGEPFNLSERRPLVILSESEDEFLVEGFYHRAEFWKAVIPRNGVAQIVGQRFNFSKQKRRDDGSTRSSWFFVNHVQARIRMEPEKEVTLFAENDDTTGQPTHRVSDFAYSVEAVGPYGRRWNIWDALMGNLAIVHRFLSTEEVAFERIMRERMTVLESPPLPLAPDILNTMLEEAIRESHTACLARPYFMFRLPFSAANCTSEPLKLMDDVLRTPRTRRFLYRLPIHPRGYLKLRGLWQSGQQPPTLNEQMADWLASEAAKARREIHVNKKKQLPKRAAPKVSLSKHLSSLPKAMRSR